MWASLPAAFHNDGDGRKAAWRGKILDRLREVTGQEARGALPKSLERAAPYLQFLKCFNAAREKEQEDDRQEIEADEGEEDASDCLCLSLRISQISQRARTRRVVRERGGPVMSARPTRERKPF